MTERWPPIKTRGGMLDSKERAETNVEHLKDQLAYLMARMDQLSSRIAALENGKVAIQKEIEPPQSVKHAPPPSEKVWDMVGGEQLFSRIAAVCFMLVFALILRTVADSGILNPTTGSIVGICYTFILILWGWRLFSRKSALAIVFPICGALLLFTVLIETNATFDTVPSIYGLTILFGAEILLGFMGHRFQQASLLYLATVGVSLTAILLDFPNNDFAAVALLLLTVNILALHIQRSGRTQALPWSPCRSC